MPPPRKTPKPARPQRSSTSTLPKTEIIINVYDLLPAGKLSSLLWNLGTSLLHSGVVINGREYAYGGHDRRGVTGVYWTKPGVEPPGGTFRCEILHGFTYMSLGEIEATIREASNEFYGPAYNLLTKNCNHFTSFLCRKLTDRPGPSWLNRAASLGVALPCIVPRDWIEPPDFGLADGELLNEYDEDDDATENSRMLRSSSDHPRLVGIEDPSDDEWRAGSSRQDSRGFRDSSGRQLPAAERAPSVRS